jgi:hypothetical protein
MMCCSHLSFAPSSPFSEANAFAPDLLAQIAFQLDRLELSAYAQNNEGGVYSKDYLNRLAEGSGNVDAQGNFSIEVLRAALKSKYGLDLPNIRQEGVASSGDVTDLEGFICNKVGSSVPVVHGATVVVACFLTVSDCHCPSPPD